MNDAQVIGDRIRTSRRRLALTQADLAKLADVHPMSVTRWETGRGSPALAVVRRLADVLQVSPGWLLGLDEKRSPAPAPTQEPAA